MEEQEKGVTKFGNRLKTKEDFAICCDDVPLWNGIENIVLEIAANILLASRHYWTKRTLTNIIL